MLVTMLDKTKLACQSHNCFRISCHLFCS